MNIRNVFAVTCVLLMCGVALSCSSVSAQGLKVGVFDIRMIIRDSKTIQGYRAKLERDMTRKRNRLTEKQDWIKAIEEKLRDDQTIPPNDRRALLEKLTTERREFRRMREDIEIELQRIDRELARRTMGEIATIISNLAKTGGYSLILERSSAGIAYMDNTLDLTSKIVNLFDEKHVQ